MLLFAKRKPITFSGSHFHQSTINQSRERKHTFTAISFCANQNFDPVNVKGLSLAEKLSLQKLRHIMIRNLKHRLANMVLFLDELPYGVSFTPTIDQLIRKYLDAFDMLFTLTSENDPNFDEVMKKLLNFNSKDPIEIAVGINEWKAKMKDRYQAEDSFESYSSKIDECLDKFYAKRTSGRLMCQNYFSIRETGKSVTEKNIDFTAIINEAYLMSKLLCNNKYGRAPEIKVEGGLTTSFNYVTPHLMTILLELLKNSMEATMLRWEHEDTVPPVTILITQCDKKVVLRIHDEGIGISPTDIDKIWSYFYSTSSDSIHKSDKFNSNFAETLSARLDNHPSLSLSGFGYGLPLTKTLLQFFNGRITINSIKNNCTDVYIYFGSND